MYCPRPFPVRTLAYASQAGSIGEPCELRGSRTVLRAPRVRLPGAARLRCRAPTQAGCGAIAPRRSGEAGPVRSQPSPGQDPPREVWPVRVTEPPSARDGQAGDFRLSGLHALLQDNPERTLSAWSQTGRQTGQQDPGTHRRGAPQALAPRHLGSWKVARAGLQWLAQLLCRPGVGPVHPCVPPKAATPVDAGAAPPVPASPLQLEAFGTHDPATLAARCHPPPMAGPAVCRQSPEVGAGWFNDHVRVCAGGVQQCAFLPRSYPASLHGLPT